MDVEAQTDEEWPISRWVEYFDRVSGRSKGIYNVISIEFTHSKLEHCLQAPEIAKKMDWVQFWPAEFKDPTIQLRGKMSFPKVQHYCLMGAAGAYTDFHIDFGGTSVWYHVVRGQKLFLLIPPTPENLKLYEEWINNPNQDDIFFADKVDAAVCVTVNEGNSLLIPTGWIHAVYTPLDSFVFGGNFLHSYNMKLQLDIAELEGRSKVRRKFRFPFFEETNWFAIENYVERILSEAKKSHARSSKESGNSKNSKFLASASTQLSPSTKKIQSASLANNPQLQTQLWAAFQRTGLPSQHFPAWAEQVIAYGSNPTPSNLESPQHSLTNAQPHSPHPSRAISNSSSPRPQLPSPSASPQSSNSPMASADMKLAPTYPPSMQAQTGHIPKTPDFEPQSIAGSLPQRSSSPHPHMQVQANNYNALNALQTPFSHQHLPADAHGAQMLSFDSQLLQNAQNTTKEDQELQARRAVFAKGEFIDSSWLSPWEREGLVSLLDWLPAAKELFPLCIYNQPGGPGKAQFYIDVLTCFLRGVPLPSLTDYLKLHANDPSPYEPATVICRLCLRDEGGNPETWIGCDYCSHWWHANCLGISKQQAEAMDNYFCAECRPIVASTKRTSRDLYNWIVSIPPSLNPNARAQSQQGNSVTSSLVLGGNNANPVNIAQAQQNQNFANANPNLSQLPSYATYHGQQQQNAFVHLQQMQPRNMNLAAAAAAAVTATNANPQLTAIPPQHAMAANPSHLQTYYHPSSQHNQYYSLSQQQHMAQNMQNNQTNNALLPSSLPHHASAPYQNLYSQHHIMQQHPYAGTSSMHMNANTAQNQFMPAPQQLNAMNPTHNNQPSNINQQDAATNVSHAYRTHPQQEIDPNQLALQQQQQQQQQLYQQQMIQQQRHQMMPSMHAQPAGTHHNYLHPHMASYQSQNNPLSAQPALQHHIAPIGDQASQETQNQPIPQSIENRSPAPQMHQTQAYPEENKFKPLEQIQVQPAAIAPLSQEETFLEGSSTVKRQKLEENA